jgi:hypothetical protein
MAIYQFILSLQIIGAQDLKKKDNQNTLSYLPRRLQEKSIFLYLFLGFFMQVLKADQFFILFSKSFFNLY